MMLIPVICCKSRWTLLGSVDSELLMVLLRLIKSINICIIMLWDSITISFKEIQQLMDL